MTPISEKTIKLFYDLLHKPELYSAEQIREAEQIIADHGGLENASYREMIPVLNQMKEKWAAHKETLYGTQQ